MADVFETAERLKRAGESFVIATVVRVERPTSAQPGDKAILTEGGLLEGWIGGSCAEPTVLRESRAALIDGECRLLHISANTEPQPGRQGLTIVPMTCYSGGTVEIYIEPHLAAPILAVYGQSPVAAAVAELGRALKYRVIAWSLRSDIPDRENMVANHRPEYAVVATHGVFDEDALEHAIASGARYVGLVASQRRAESVRAVLAAKGVDAQGIRSPAGLALGARTAEEIALSIVAEIVATRRAHEKNADAPTSRDTAVTPATELPAANASCCARRAESASPQPTAATNLEAILLAAGESRRMGGVNKLLLPIGGQALVRRSAETLIASGVAQPIVVLGFEAERVREALAGLPVRFVVNEQYRDGQETSVRAGLGALPDTLSGVLICLSDQPSLTVEDLRELQAAFFARKRGSALVPLYRGQRGNPIILDRRGLETILLRGGKFGCRQFTTQHSDLVETYEMSSDHVLRDLDRPEDVSAWDGRSTAR